MNSVLVATFENQSDAKSIAQLIKKMKFKAYIVKPKELEDFYMASLIDEGMKEKGEIPVEKFSAHLSKRIQTMK